MDRKARLRFIPPRRIFDEAALDAYEAAENAAWATRNSLRNEQIDGLVRIVELTRTRPAPLPDHLDFCVQGYVRLGGADESDICEVSPTILRRKMVRLEKALSAAGLILSDLNPAEYEIVDRALEWQLSGFSGLGPGLGLALDNLRRLQEHWRTQPPPGRPSAEWAATVAQCSAQCYFAITGRKPTTITDPVTGEMGGPFVAFLGQTFAVLGIRARVEARAKAAVREFDADALLARAQAKEQVWEDRLARVGLGKKPTAAGDI